MMDILLTLAAWGLFSGFLGYLTGRIHAAWIFSREWQCPHCTGDDGE